MNWLRGWIDCLLFNKHDKKVEIVLNTEFWCCRRCGADNYRTY